MSFVIIAGQPDLLDSNKQQIGQIDLYYDSTRNLYLSGHCYFAPNLNVIGNDPYDYVNLSLLIDDKNKPYLTFIDLVNNSAHFNLTWPRVNNLNNFLFGFFLSSTTQLSYPYIHIWFNSDTYTAGVDTTDSHTHYYSLKFH
jgi:hypothetical protein